MGQVFAPRPGTALVPLFCRHLLARHPDPLDLATRHIWVPSRRVGQTLAEALARQAGGASLMPRIRTLSLDPDQAPSLDLSTPLPDASPLRRHMFLLQALRQANPGWTLGQASQQAESLGQVFDALFDQGLTLADIQQIIPPELAQHWESNLTTLRLVFDAYPAWLSSLGTRDPRQALKEQVEQQIRQYQNQAPGPVYALGFADTTPLGRQLLAALLALPEGEVWPPPTPVNVLREKLPLTHPLAATSQLLSDLKISPEQVTELGDVAPQHEWLLHAFLPPTQTWRWAKTTPPAPSLTGLSLITAPSLDLEAETLALIMRQDLERPGITALVTPHRTLARLVAERLAHWGIRVNDSAGQPFITTPLGKLLELLTKIRQAANPSLALASLLSHALVACPPQDFYTLDRLWLRRPLPATGLEAALAQAEAQNLAPTTLAWLRSALTPLMNLHQAPLTTWHDTLLTTLKALAHHPEGPPRDPAGQEEASTLANLQQHLSQVAEPLGPLTPPEALNYLTTLWQNTPLRLSQGQHPRLYIWGTAEARLQEADHLILAALNQGDWPRSPSQLPWLPPPVAEALGLPSPALRQGLNAHDFYSLMLAAPRVTLSRSLKNQDSTPTLASPYLERLATALGPQHPGWQGVKMRGKAWLDQAFSLRLTSADTAPQPPAQAPITAALLPHDWSMSHIRDLMQCPFKAYAKYLLGLPELKPYNPEPDSRDWGTLVHTLLQAFLQPLPGWPSPLPQPLQASQKPQALGHWALLTEQGLATLTDPTLLPLWRPRLLKMGEHFIQALLDHPRQVQATEHKVTLGQNPRLTARLDRLDRSPQGQVVVDYKTSAQTPSWDKVTQGWEPQLLVEAALLTGQGHQVADLEFWQLNARNDAVEIKRFSDQTTTELPTAIAQTQQALAQLQAVYYTPQAEFSAIPRGASVLALKEPCRHCPYQGVCRVHEWYGKGPSA